ncbi:hypothetical protein G6F32_013143 [Rhizopus arrhizus]|uniref:Uncharacterized protein n=1 Tax=Rhizopus oryzae TaxID=64495 RepID=A0A9P7BYG0_RHIOR|nr:hypothetical protein G6F32_013143 [Rhizopus arrhizus]KAG1508740.1 hypothetical protein G6F51_014812 [Rhizopus arrhizus]
MLPHRHQRPRRTPVSILRQRGRNARELVRIALHQDPRQTLTIRFVSLHRFKVAIDEAQQGPLAVHLNDFSA